MRLKALDNSQTDRGSVARYTSTALELRDVCGRCPTAVRPFDPTLLLKGQATSACTRKASEVSGSKHRCVFLTHICAMDPKGMRAYMRYGPQRKDFVLS